MNILRFILFNIIFCIVSFGADLDFDGVSDDIDKCLNTPFEYLVDEDGCPIDKNYYGSINLELNYIKYKEVDKIIDAKSIYIDYNYNNYLISFSKSFYDENIYNISYISFGYKIVLKNSLIKIYLGRMSDNSYFINPSYEYYNEQYIYFINLNNTNATYDKDYLSFNMGLDYSIDNQKDFSISYIDNSTSNSIDLQVRYSLDDKYVKLGLDKDIQNKQIYNIYFGIGVYFE